MSSRGSAIKNGHVTTEEYLTKRISTNGVKILEGVGKNHSLPDFSHSPNTIYAKVRKDGTLKEIRFYDSDGFPIIEIGYHPERYLDKSGNRVVHYHLYHKLLRDDPQFINEDIKKKYEKYLKEFNLYDKC